jgi:hypothetical protein
MMWYHWVKWLWSPVMLAMSDLFFVFGGWTCIYSQRRFLCTHWCHKGCVCEFWKQEVWKIKYNVLLILKCRWVPQTGCRLFFIMVFRIWYHIIQCAKFILSAIHVLKKNVKFISHLKPTAVRAYMAHLLENVSWTVTSRTDFSDCHVWFLITRVTYIFVSTFSYLVVLSNWILWTPRVSWRRGI